MQSWICALPGSTGLAQELSFMKCSPLGMFFFRKVRGKEKAGSWALSWTFTLDQVWFIGDTIFPKSLSKLVQNIWKLQVEHQVSQGMVMTAAWVTERLFLGRSRRFKSMEVPRCFVSTGLSTTPATASSPLCTYSSLAVFSVSYHDKQPIHAIPTPSESTATLFSLFQIQEVSSYLSNSLALFSEECFLPWCLSICKGLLSSFCDVFGLSSFMSVSKLKLLSMMFVSSSWLECTHLSPICCLIFKNQVWTIGLSLDRPKSNRVEVLDWQSQLKELKLCSIFFFFKETQMI